MHASAKSGTDVGPSKGRSITLHSQSFLCAAGQGYAGKEAGTGVITDAGGSESHCLAEGVCAEWTTVAYDRPGGSICQCGLGQ
eukprot:3151565-Rhodomonas_salina.2